MLGSCGCGCWSNLFELELLRNPAGLLGLIIRLVGDRRVLFESKKIPSNRSALAVLDRLLDMQVVRDDDDDAVGELEEEEDDDDANAFFLLLLLLLLVPDGTPSVVAVAGPDKEAGDAQDDAWL